MAEFEWDRRKAATNERKHGVRFEEARSVFNDPRALVAFDPGHSYDEDRYRAIGISERGRMLLVVFVPLDPTGAHIRMVSARRATGSEVKEYAEANA